MTWNKMTINSTVVHQVSKELMASNTISEVNTSITYDYEHNEFSEVCFRLKRGQTQLLEEFKKRQWKEKAERSPEEMSQAPAEAYAWCQYDPTHMHRLTHTLVLQWWWGPERLISHHGEKLKGCQLSSSPSSVSCCLQVSAPCCVFWFQAEGKDHLKSKLRRWIKTMGLARYGDRSQTDGRLKIFMDRLKSALDMVIPSSVG